MWTVPAETEVEQQVRAAEAGAWERTGLQFGLFCLPASQRSPAYLGEADYSWVPGIMIGLSRVGRLK